MLHDHRGLAVSTDSAQALEHFESALQQFHTYRGDPIATLDRRWRLTRISSSRTWPRRSSSSRPAKAATRRWRARPWTALPPWVAAPTRANVR